MTVPLLPRLSLLLAALAISAAASDAPRPWPPDQFLPVTPERIGTLSATEQPAWRAYWNESLARNRLLPANRDLVDHSLQVPSNGPPIPAHYSHGVRLGAAPAYYATEEARVIADRVANWQTVVGGWVKSGDYSRNRKPEDDQKDAWSSGTFDNDSTIYEMRYLALVNQAAADGPRARAWRESFLRGLDFILAAQYPNGGFPQVNPLVGWYHDAITYNDDAMEHAVELLRDIAVRKPGLEFVPAGLAAEAGRRVERGVQCILASQLRGADGRRTVWGQQIDALTLRPCAARNFEPISECSSESSHLVEFLMTVPDPSPEIVDAIEGAIPWYTRMAIHGMAQNRSDTHGSGLVPKADAPDLWARFYEIGTGKPIFGDRDRTIHYVFGELSNERRKGYGWYRTEPEQVFAAYQAWKQRMAAAKPAPTAAN